jgi:hypothetical protein
MSAKDPRLADCGDSERNGARGKLIGGESWAHDRRGVRSEPDPARGAVGGHGGDVAGECGRVERGDRRQKVVQRQPRATNSAMV